MTDTANLNVAWHKCPSLCGQWMPIGKGMYCCKECAEAFTGKYVLDGHTAGCRDRQNEYERTMDLRGATTGPDGRN